jgi:hypothetical protein
MQREGCIKMLETPELQPDGTRLWRGKVELDLIARQFPSDTTLQTLPKLDYHR